MVPFRSTTNRSRGFQAGLLLLVPVALPLAGQPAIEDPRPLTPGGEAAELSPQGSSAWRVRSAAYALESGMPFAASLLEQALADPGLAPEDRRSAQRLLIRALLAEQRLDAVARRLAEAPPAVRSLPETRLAAAWVAWDRGNAGAREAALEDLDTGDLDPSVRAWLPLLRGLVSEGEGRLSSAAEAFSRARALATSDRQRSQIDLLIERNQLIGGSVDEEQITSLRQRIGQYAGQRIAFQYAEELAVALHRNGRSEEALALLEEQITRAVSVAPSLADHMRLLTALIAGADSEAGRSALRRLLEAGQDPALMRQALLLLTGPASGERDALFAFLDRLAFRRPPHPLLAEIYYRQAQLARGQDRLEAVVQSARQLLDQFPGSPLVDGAVRLLALASWEAGQYREAARYLDDLRQRTEDPAESARLGVFMADAAYLDGDFDLAADLYQAALDHPDNPLPAGRILFQLVLAETRAGRLDAATAHLDAAARLPGVTPQMRWEGEWALARALREAGRVAEAFDRVNRLLETGAGETLSELLSLRLYWLQAQLSVEVGRTAETPALADRLLAFIEALPTGTITPEQDAALRSRTLLLKGQALLSLRDREGFESEALRVFRTLRDTFPESPAALFSFLLEARYLADTGQTVAALQRLVELADQYSASSFAPQALYEASVLAENLGNLERAARLLERLLDQYPEAPYQFYARLKQGNLLRKQAAFDEARVLYEAMLRDFNDHPERYLAEINRADTLRALAGDRPARMEDAVSAYERLVDRPDVPEDLQVEAGFKWGEALLRQAAPGRAEGVFNRLILDYLETPGAARQLGGTGRYWISRTLFELGNLVQERYGDAEAARRLFDLVLTYNLPGQALARASIERLQSASTPGPSDG